MLICDLCKDMDEGTEEVTITRTNRLDFGRNNPDKVTTKVLCIVCLAKLESNIDAIFLEPAWYAQCVEKGAYIKKNKK